MTKDVWAAPAAAVLGAGLFFGDVPWSDAAGPPDVPLGDALFGEATWHEPDVPDARGIAPDDLVRAAGRPGRYRAVGLSYDDEEPYLLAPADPAAGRAMIWAHPAQVTPD